MIIRFLVGQAEGIEAKVDRQVQSSAPITQQKSEVLLPPGPSCRNRVFEWWMAAALISIAITLTLAPNSLTNSRFWLITEYGVATVPILMFCLVVGLARVLALKWNGTWPYYGTRVRAIGCFCGAVVWSQLALALIGNSQLDAISITVGIMICLTCGELQCASRALLDAKFDERRC